MYYIRRMKTEPKKLRAFSVRLKESEFRHLERASVKLGTSKGEVIRRALIQVVFTWLQNS